MTGTIPPVWLMRQAGRYLPEYREKRKSFSKFFDLVFSPKDASQVTLQPINRFGFDAAILFSDILVIPYALGQEVDFENGVRLGPLPKKKLNDKAVLEKLCPIFETVERTCSALPQTTPLIGFAGAPWTVLCYMLGGTSRDHFAKTRKIVFENSPLAEQWLSILEHITSLYLEKQIQAGARAIQIFDTWACLVPLGEQNKWLIEPVSKIVSHIKKKYPTIPVIFYAKGAHHTKKTFLKSTQTDAISVDSKVDLNKIKKLNMVIQGNLDPKILVAGGKKLFEETEKIIKPLKNSSFIFNLGHGILPETPLENVSSLLMHLRQGHV